MTKRKVTGVAVALFFCVAVMWIQSFRAQATSLSGISSSTIQQMQTQISEAQREREALQQSLSDVKEMVRQLEKEKTSLANYVSKLDQNLAQIEEKIAELSNQIVEKELQITETQRQLEEALQQEVTQNDFMQKHIKFVYEKGATHYLELLLMAESFSDLLNQFTYVATMAEYDTQMLEDYIAHREYVELCKQQLDEEKALLDETKAGVESEKQTMEVLIQEKAAEIQRYETNINTQEQAIEEYEEDLEAQTELIAQLEAAVIEEQKRILEENGVVLEYDGGAFVFPLASYTRVSSDYGWRIHPTLNVRKFHNGVDFAAPKGTAIYAAYDGVVVASAYSSTMGNYVMINHGGGLYTIYMHASKLNVSKDEIVVRGEKIAEVGSTGRSTGNHLHFTIRKNGEYISPWEYISE